MRLFLCLSLDLLFYKAWLQVNVLISRLEVWRRFFNLTKIHNEIFVHSSFGFHLIALSRLKGSELMGT